MITRWLPAALFGLALALTPASAQIVLPGGGGSGSVVSSLTTNCPPAGPLTGAVTLNGYLSNSRSVSGITDTLLASDCGGVVQYTNSGSIAVSIAASGSTGFTAPGYWVGIKNSGSGTITVTPASGTINGNATLTVSAGTDLQLVAFGSGIYITMNGTGASGTGTVASGTGGDCANYPSTGTTVSSSAGVPCPPQFSPVVATFKPLWPTLTAGTGVAETASTALCAPFIAPLNQHWDQITATVVTGGGVGTNVQFAIYADGLNATSGAHQPVGAAVYSSSSISDQGSTPLTVTWALGTSGVGQAITAGPNWICLNADNSTVVFLVNPNTSSYMASLIGALVANHSGQSSQSLTGLKISQTFGTWPTFTTSSSFTEVTNATSVTYSYRIATTP